MVVSLSNIPKDSQVYRFITSGKPGRCKFCHSLVDKLEAHHLSYSPEIIIKVCHSCHHKIHFWPQRLNEHEKHLLLSKKLSPEAATKMINENLLSPVSFSKLIAPSRKSFILNHLPPKIKRIEKPSPFTKEIIKEKPVKKPERKLFK